MTCSNLNKHASGSGGTVRELSQKVGWRESLARWAKVGLLAGVTIGSALPTMGLAGNMQPWVAPVTTKPAIPTTGTGVIQGVKFNDLNGNGVQDAGEKGFPAETILVRNNTLANANPTEGQYKPVTDMNGHYRLTGLPAGNYTVRTAVAINIGGKLEEFWQTAPIRVEEIGTPEPYDLDLPDNKESQVNFGLWDGVERRDCTLCVTVNDQQAEAGGEVAVGGNVVDKLPDGSNLTITVEAFGYSAVKTVAAADRVAGASIPIELGVSFPKGGEYPVKITVTSDNGANAEGTGTVVVRDLETSAACDVKVVNVWSTRSGKWDDPVVWSTGHVPGPNDWVMVASGHTVKVPAVTTQQLKKKEVLQVKGLCVAQGAKLGKFFYRKLTTPPPGLATTSGTRSVRAVNDACTITPTKTAKALSPPGLWTEASTWDPPGVPPAMPGPKDNVLIPANVGVVIPYTTTPNTENKVNKLCNKGVLMSPSELPPDNQQYWLALNPKKLDNQGTIVSNDGAAGGNGVGIYLGSPTESQNSGTIQSGNGGDAGNGGPIEINPNNLSNTGTFQLGSGGQCNAHMGWCPKSGDGGTLTINGTGTIDISGTVIGGNGGAAGSVGAGSASPININGNPANIKPGAVVQGQNGVWYQDPIQLKLETNISIHSGDISFVSDDNGKIEVGNLSEGAITAERTLTWAIGKGGIIDFSQVSDKAFKAGQEMVIYTDNLILPAGKTLAQLVDAPKVTLLPAKLLMNAGWFTTEETMVGSPGEQLLLPLTLNNLGPAKDTYTLTVTNPQGWSMCDLPKTVAVNSQRNVKLECNVTLPTTRGTENTVIITAASQTDPALQVTTTLHLQVAVEQYDLYGEVIDNNGQPVKGATVQVGDKITSTDDQGQWIVMDLPVGDYNVTTSKEGYVFSSQPVTVSGQTTLMTISGHSQPATSVGNGLTISDSVYTVVVTPNPTPGPETEMQIVDNGDGSYTGTNGLMTVEIKPKATDNSDDTVMVTDSETPNLAATLNDDGSLSVTNEESPGTVVTANADGTSTVTSTTFPGLTATVNSEGNTVVTDVTMPGIEVAFDQTGKATVTDLDSGMSAVRNADGTYTVSDPQTPEVLAIVNPSDSSAQLIDSKTGQCLTADSDNARRGTRSFFGKGGFLDKATSFIGKVAGVVNTAANFVGNVAGAVNTVANWFLKIAPTSVFAAKVAAVSNTVKTVANTVSAVSNTVTKVVSGIRKFFGWMIKPFSFRSVRADTSPNCPIVTPDEGPYSASGTIKDKLGPVTGVTIQIAGKTATTDATGHWEITGLTASNYTAEATKDGYLSLIQQFEVSEAMPNATVPFKLASLLKIQVSTQPKVAKQGDNVTYLINVTNNGTRPATGLVLQDVIPDGATLVSLEGDNCEANTLRCTFSELAPGATAKVTLVVTAPTAGKQQNTAHVAANEYPAEVVVTTKEIMPSLFSTTRCTPNPVPMLTGLHCVVTVNLNPDVTTPATGVKVVTTLPTSVTLQAATTDFGTCDTSQFPTVTCTLNELSPTVNQATVNLDMTLIDAGLLAFTQETTVSSDNYGSHSSRARTSIQIPPNIQVDLALVIDITGSMQGEIDGAKAALRQFIATLDPAASPLVALIVFKDDVTVKAFTKDLTLLLKAIESLKAEGGGTCPEASVEAVAVAALHVKPGGIIWFSTDASPYPDAEIQPVLDLMQGKNIRFNATVTGDCTSAGSANEGEWAMVVNQ